MVGTAAWEPSFGEASLNPFNFLGKQSRADGFWSGRRHAVHADRRLDMAAEVELPDPGRCDADRGRPCVFRRRRRKLLRARRRQWPTATGQKIGGAIAGGVITYTANGLQKVAVATGFISPVWPVEIKTARIAILGLEGSRSQ